MASVRACSWLTLPFVIALGCSSDPAPMSNDAGGPVDTGGPVDAPIAVDVPADTGRAPRSPQPIYGPCDSAAECRDGLICRRSVESGLPGGQCNVECTRDDQCVRYLSSGDPIDGYCQQPDPAGHRYCARVCVNGIDCGRDGYSCLTVNGGTISSVMICTPVCTDDSCIDGTVCDHETGRCHAPTDPTPVGRTVGQSCVATTDPAMTPATVCRSGFCSVQVTHDSMGVPFETGFNGGFCYARCILPSGYNSSNLWAGDTLPQANCPDHAICFPNGSLAEQDLGICLPSCSADSDCRESEGYKCRKSFVLGTAAAPHTYRFMNGYCTPYDCAAAGAAACPTGLMCRRTTSGTTTTGRCIPQTSM